MRSLDQKENGFINMLMQVFVPVFIYYFVNNAVVILGLTALEMLYTEVHMEVSTDSYRFYIETIIKMAGMALGGLAVYPYFKKENSLKEQKSLSAKAVLSLIITGAVLSLGINFLFSAIGFTQSSEQYQQVAETQFALPLWLACFFYGVLSPVVEETVFRGVVFNALTRNTTKIMSVTGSALLFGAFHGNVVQMIYGSLMGVIMACIYQKYRNLLGAILFHGAANVAIYVVTYFF